MEFSPENDAYEIFAFLTRTFKYLDRFKRFCYIASAETKRDWLIHGHVALDKCNVSLGQ